MAKCSTDCGSRFKGSDHPTVRQNDFVGGSSQQTDGTPPYKKKEGYKRIKNK